MQPGSGVNITFLPSLSSLQQCIAKAVILNDLNSIDITLTQHPETDMLNLLLYGSPKLNDSQNKTILSATIQFIVSSEGLMVHL